MTLTWDDPNDDSITGYVILRRDKDIHEEGSDEARHRRSGAGQDRRERRGLELEQALTLLLWVRIYARIEAATR